VRLREISVYRLRAAVQSGVARQPARPASLTGPSDGRRESSAQCGNLVSMTSIGKTSSAAGRRRESRRARPGQWQLQEAKARFSEVVRRAKQEGPQHVTVHGREEVVVIGADDFRRLAGERSGQVLVDALQTSPHKSTSIGPPRFRMRVRDVDL